MVGFGHVASKVLGASGAAAARAGAEGAADVVARTPAAATRVVASSKALRAALKGAGFSASAGEAAHHIVAGTAKAAAPARAVLARFGIAINDAANGVLLAINGTPREDGWQPIPVNLVHEDEGRKLAASDSPWLGSHAIIFRRQALAKLDAHLREYGELLPLSCPEAELLVFNPTRVLDALDEPASLITRFSNGRIMRVTRYAFRAEVVSGVDIFKIPNLRVSPTFLGERIVRAWGSAGLRGLVFNKVWSV
jgi:hypothetical protein